MRKTVSWLISLVISAIIFLAVMGHILFVENSEAPDVVILGDSIVGDLIEGKGINTYLEEKIGRKVLNGGFGGSYATYIPEEAFPASVACQLSLVRLSEAIVTDDFLTQKALIAYGDHYYDVMRQTLDYFEATVRALDKTDFSKVKYLVIEHGTNDYNRGVVLENLQDKYDESTYAGALRSSIERLQKAYPDLQIILMTPTWCYVTREYGFLNCDETDFGGGILEDFVNLEIEIAAEYDIPVLDNYHQSGIDKETANTYLRDGLHLSSEGQKLIAERLAALMLELEKR